MKKYETERLIIKPTNTEDAKFIFEIMNTPKYYKYIGDRNIKSLEDAENYIKNRMLLQYEKVGFGNFTIILKSDDSKIGFVGIYLRDGLDIPDIGFAVFEEFEGKGYAFEAASELKKLAKTEFGLQKLSGITVEYNHSSRKLLEKLGLKFQKKFFMEGDPEELMYYETEL